MNTLWRLIVTICLIPALMPSAVAQTSLASPKGIPQNVYVRHVERSVLGKDVAHYRFEVVVGPGQFDVIQLHRIVREKYPWQPIHAVTGVLLFPGAPNSFEMIFMEPQISQVPAWDQSITAFLAKNDVDVWGMDYRWSLVPAATTNFDFMKSWGLKRDVDDAKIALSLAHLIRGATGQGFGKLHLLGFSYGTYIAYAIGNQETQLPQLFRNVKGLIAVDWGIVYAPDSSLRSQLCDLMAPAQALYDAGIYSEDNSGLKQFGDLARSDPDGTSPFEEGFTNYQFALFVGASVSYSPSWHFVGGIFNDSGVTTGLLYSDPWLWIDVIRAVPPYFTVKADLDTDTVSCFDVVAPFDEHLGKITLPILYVGAAGGTGRDGYYALTRTASKDITKFTVQLQPDDGQGIDFGHADLFTATNADTLVWQPILDWLVAHR
jgi:pimeloyl-ACP methyl ester carboxylesterase